MAAKQIAFSQREKISMKKVVIYSTDVCPYCERAKQLLTSKQATYTEIRIDKERGKLEEMLERAKQRSVPQIFIGDYHVGGFDKLYALEQAGKLDALLNDNSQDD